MCGLIVRAALIGVVVVVLAVVAGFGVGVALERSGSVDPVAEPDAATVRDAMVVTVDCPGGNPVVALGRADRILVTGRDEERDWVELRSPIDARRRGVAPGRPGRPPRRGGQPPGPHLWCAAAHARDDPA